MSIVPFLLVLCIGLCREEDILHDSDAVLVEKEDVDLSVLAREVTPLVGNDP